MKRFLFILLAMAIISMPLIAMGEKETKKLGITILSTSVGQAERDAYIVKQFPNVDVKFLTVNLTTGSTISMDSMIASGTPPDIYSDSMVRVSKYITKDFALPLDKYVTNIDKYTSIDFFKRDGKVYGLPESMNPQGMLVNLDVLKEIGYTIPNNWTIDDFLNLAKLVKEKYDGKKYVTGFFAGNQSGDYLLNNWHSSFGAEFFVNNDYTKTTIKSTGGVKTFEFWKKLYDNGYIDKNSPTFVDDDFLLEWSKGNIVATGFYEAWASVYHNSAIEQKLISKPFEYTFVQYPSATGKAPKSCFQMAGLVVSNSTNEARNQVAGKILETMTQGYIGDKLASLGTYPSFSLGKLDGMAEKLKFLGKMAEKNGLYDLGVFTPQFPAIRAAGFPIHQKLLRGELTPEQAISQYEKTINDILKE